MRRHFNGLAMHWQQYDVIVNKKEKQLRKIYSVKDNLNYQFNLCCNTSKKRSSPPVKVRYNSITEQNCTLARSNLSLGITPMTQNTHCRALNVINTNLLKLESDENCNLTKNVGEFTEECSKKVSLTFQSSTSCFQIKDLHGDTISHSKHDNTSKHNSSPIHPIAVSDCRSRLRVKLFPPDNDLLLSQHPIQFSASGDKMLPLKPHYGSILNIPAQKKICKFGCNKMPSPIDQFSSVSLQRSNDCRSELGKTLLKPNHESYLLKREKVGKSFLEGTLQSASLLGHMELAKVVPNKEVTVFVGTWNMNGHIAPKHLRDFVLPVNVEFVPDIVTIGTQETTPDRFDWEVTIQETLGPSHVLFHSTSLGTLHLAIFIRRELIWYCSAPEDSSMSVRTGSAFRTKGAVAISFSLFGTSILFVTSHLTAHQEKVKERVADVKRIINSLDLPKNLNLRHKSKDVTQNFDNVFWCGDLNFRLSEPRENLLKWIQNTKFPLPSHLPHGLMHTDQLSSILSDGATFKGFMEANITFPPTYKYDPGTQHFDTSYKQRAPAYTDRILYKFRQSQGMRLRCQRVVPASQTNRSYIQCLLYDSVPTIITSDHKPVWALFKTSIRAGTDSVPLAAGLFNRDVYLEGMKRRLHNQCSESSAVCSIQ